MSPITVNDITYNVEISGQGTPLVLLHGFTGAAENWLTHMPFFADIFTVIAPDLPGHGKTDVPNDVNRYSIESTAADLIALLDTLTQEPFHLLGYSMGGRLALYIALTYPQRVRSLILESASPGLENDGERQQRKASDDALADRIEREGVEAFVDHWESLPLFATQTDAMRATLRSGRLKHNPRGLANSLRGIGTGVQPSLWHRLAELQMPVLLMAGELDAKFLSVAEQMQESIPAASLNIVPAAGHTIHLEQLGLYQQRIYTFLIQTK